jgi:hypothetical protein
VVSNTARQTLVSSNTAQQTLVSSNAAPVVSNTAQQLGAPAGQLAAHGVLRTQVEALDETLPPGAPTGQPTVAPGQPTGAPAEQLAPVAPTPELLTRAQQWARQLEQPVRLMQPRPTPLQQDQLAQLPHLTPAQCEKLFAELFESEAVGADFGWRIGHKLGTAMGAKLSLGTAETMCGVLLGKQTGAEVGRERTR